MDYIVKVNGKEILIEMEEKSYTNRGRLLAYYKYLLSKKGINDDAPEQEKLKTFVDEMTEKYAGEVLESVKNEAFFNRMKAYMGQFSKIEKEKADALLEVVKGETTGRKFNSMMINGNKFLFEDGFEIEKFAKRLHDIGNDIQGETWTVYMDEEDGELVIY